MGVGVGPLGTLGVGVLPCPPSHGGSFINDTWQPVLLNAKRIRSTAKANLRVLKFNRFINPLMCFLFLFLVLVFLGKLFDLALYLQNKEETWVP